MTTRQAQSTAPKARTSEEARGDSKPAQQRAAALSRQEQKLREQVKERLEKAIEQQKKLSEVLERQRLTPAQRALLEEEIGKRIKEWQSILDALDRGAPLPADFSGALQLPLPAVPARLPVKEEGRRGNGEEKDGRSGYEGRSGSEAPVPQAPLPEPPATPIVPRLP
jgi:hypothetical protein